MPPYGVGPTDVGLPGEPAVSPSFGVPDGHRRTIEHLIGRILTLQHLPQLHGDLLDVLVIESHETVELGTLWELGGVRLAEVIHDDVEYGEEGVLESSM